MLSKFSLGSFHLMNMSHFFFTYKRNAMILLRLRFSTAFLSICYMLEPLSSKFYKRISFGTSMVYFHIWQVCSRFVLGVMTG